MLQKIPSSVRLISVVIVSMIIMVYAASLLIRPNSPQAVAPTTAPSAVADAPSPTADLAATQPTAASGGPTAVSSSADTPSAPLEPLGGFHETFDGAPTSPLPWNPSNWDLTVHSRDTDTWYELEPMDANHGEDCAGPPATHTISNYEDMVFICREHMMTSLRASGYGVIYLTPNQMVDFSEGEAVIRFDMSTMRTSMRDWVDIWITPFDQNLQLPLEMVVDLSGPPQNSLQVRMDMGRNAFLASVYKDFKPTEVTGDFTWQGYDEILEPDASRRDTFEIRISRNHLKVGIPAYNFWWIDSPMPELDWTRGVVQFGHHSYNPMKDCGDTPCTPNTWHWDNVEISPAVPFTLLKADRRYLNSETPASIQLSAAAPENAFLRFSGIGNKLEASYDGGKTWLPAALQLQDSSYFKDEHFRSFWMPIPAGTEQVQFRGEGWWGGDWLIRDISVWAQ